MRQVTWPVSVGMTVFLAFIGLEKSAIAGDYLHLLTSEAYQDAVAIGEVKARRDQTLVFHPTRTLIGNKLPAEITVQIPSNLNATPFEVGDAVVLTIDKKKNIYQLTSEGFKVSDPDPEKAVVLGGPLYGDDRFKFQRIINSCGRDRKFSFDGKTVSVQKFDRSQNRVVESIPIGVKQGDRYIAVGDNPPICPPEQTSFWEQITQLLSRIFG